MEKMTGNSRGKVSKKALESALGKASKEALKKRYFLLDLLRGVAVLLMVVFHFVFVLDFLNYVEFDFSSWWVVIWGNFVRVLFFVLVGFSLFVSFYLNPQGFARRRMVGLLKIFALALVISGATYLMVGDLYVRFGVVHFIGLASLVVFGFVGRPWGLWGILGLSVFARTIFGKIEAGPLGVVLGLSDLSFASIDYFPLFPWLAFVVIGVLVGRAICLNHFADFVKIDKFLARTLAELWCPRLIGWSGRNALLIYMLHIPVIVAVIAIGFVILSTLAKTSVAFWRYLI